MCLYFVSSRYIVKIGMSQGHTFEIFYFSCELDIFFLLFVLLIFPQNVITVHLLLKIFVEFRIYACQYFSTLTVSFHRCLALWTSRLLVFFISRLKLRALFFQLFLRFLSVTLFSVFKKLYVPSYVFVFVCVTVCVCFVYILLMVHIP